MVLKVSDLKGIAKANNIKGYSTMKKPELQQILFDKKLIKEEDIKKVKEVKPKKIKEVIPEENKTPYCGINELTNKQRRGTQEECVNMKKVSYYGIKAIDNNLIPNKKKEKEDRDILKSKFKLKFKLNKIEKDYKKIKDKNEILKLNTDAKSKKEYNDNLTIMEQLKKEYQSVKSNYEKYN